jgi:pyruvate carboxylase
VEISGGTLKFDEMGMIESWPGAVQTEYVFTDCKLDFSASYMAAVYTWAGCVMLRFEGTAQCADMIMFSASEGTENAVINHTKGNLGPITAHFDAAAKLALEGIDPKKTELSVYASLTSPETPDMAAVEAGAGCVDTAISTMSSFSSQPPAETMVSIFESEGFDTGLCMKNLGEINDYFMELKKIRQPSSSSAVEAVDAGVLVHAIPGGMISNLRSQLAQQGALDRLPEVLEELPKTRADMGYPPLVTTTSQIVGVQSVLNVLSGKRYSMVTDETRRYAAGLYGRTPAPIDPKLRKKLIGKMKPVDCRPADLLKPGLVAAADELPANTIEAEEDILSYALFPEVALGYFKWRKEGGPIPADVEEKKAAAPAPAAAAAEQKPAASEQGKVSGTPVVAPLNGTFYRSDAPGKPLMAADGANVKAGDAVCVVEAMKLFNPIKATAAGKIEFLVEHGQVVTKGQVLATVS